MHVAKRKLLFFWHYLEWGGAQIYFLAIIKEAIAEWDVTVILPRSSSTELVRFVELTGANIDFLDFYTDLSVAPTISQKVNRQLRRVSVEISSFRFLKKYDLSNSILHIEFPPWQSWIFYVALSFRRANVFMTMHNALPNKPAWRVIIWKLRLQIVSRLRGFHLFTSNHDTKNKLRGWVSEKFWDKIKVTYTCVNPPEISSLKNEMLDRAELRQTFDIPSDKFVVLCVGQFVDRKGRWTFLEAAKKILATRSDIQFIWVSPTLPSEGDNDRIRRYELGDGFRLVLSETVGNTHEDVLRFFRIADIFVLASFVEGLPIALLEAMALGIPSISTNVYAIPEAVKNMETGILIEAGDSNALAAAILNLLDDDKLRSHIASTGSSYVLEHFDERMASQKALDAYEERLRNV